MATLSGIGGVCTGNPGYTGPAASGPYNAAPRGSHQQGHRYWICRSAGAQAGSRCSGAG